MNIRGDVLQSNGGGQAYTNMSALGKISGQDLWTDASSLSVLHDSILDRPVCGEESASKTLTGCVALRACYRIDV